MFINDILQPTHLLFILVVALLVLGPKRLPEAGRALGRGIRDFRSAISGDEDHAGAFPTESPLPTQTTTQVPTQTPTQVTTQATPQATTPATAAAETPAAPTATHPAEPTADQNEPNATPADTVHPVG